VTPTGAHVVREHVAELILRHLADVGRAPAERRDARDGVPAEPPELPCRGPCRRTSRSAVSVSMRFIAPFGSLCLVQERVVGLGDHVDDCVADRGDIELRGTHSVVLEDLAVLVGR
jgi:hypothetical protein